MSPEAAGRAQCAIHCQSFPIRDISCVHPLAALQIRLRHKSSAQVHIVSRATQRRARNLVDKKVYLFLGHDDPLPSNLLSFGYQYEEEFGDQSLCTGLDVLEDVLLARGLNH